MLLQPKDSWDSWDCSMNTDSVKRSCKEREEFDKIVTSQLKPVFEKKTIKPVSYYLTRYFSFQKNFNSNSLLKDKSK